MNNDQGSIFWGEINPCDHVVQIYHDDAVFFDALEGFVAGALRVGDAAVVIATPMHRQHLETRLLSQGLNLDAAQTGDQYIALDADETLASFMGPNWPDEARFKDVIQSILRRARGNGRNVRAFGEMVALLWAQGHTGATVRLEHLWHSLCQEEGFALFCAYPRTGFTRDVKESIDWICATHSKVVGHPHEPSSAYGDPDGLLATGHTCHRIGSGARTRA